MMLVRSVSTRPAAIAALALAVAACGGGSPFEASSIRDGGVTLNGTVLGGVAASSGGVSAFSTADSHAFTVTVKENPDISVEVGEDGVFTLRGLPEGGFTLVFTSRDGAEGDLGELVFSEVRPNQEITITVVEGASGQIELVEEQRNGIGHGDIEIQGNIDAEPGGAEPPDTLFMIAGYPVVARPGTTAIRQGNRSLSVDDLEPGDQVHVKGVFLPLEEGQDAADQQVLAHEIKLQEEADDDDGGNDDGDGEQKVTICHKKKNTITVSINAWPAHQAHGDTMGACS